MDEVDQSIEDKIRLFKQKCREHHLSITPQRVAIYRELASSSKHPSAVEIYGEVRKYFSNISLNTVNNTLLTFHEIGLANIVEGSGDPKRFDPNLDSHHHFRCVRCGKIIDFRYEPYDTLPLPQEIEAKYVVLGKKVHLDGLCDTCREG